LGRRGSALLQGLMGGGNDETIFTGADATASLASAPARPTRAPPKRPNRAAPKPPGA
jgi:hypothetical protein